MSARWAILSVTDKTGILPLAQGLIERGFHIIASSGTARELSSAGLAVREVGDLTGVGELLGGRVKTLSPKVFAGILARREVASDAGDLERAGSGWIDVVVSNLYRFDPDAAWNAENVDIGGHTLIRAAAKNFHRVAVAVDPADYGRVLEILDAEKTGREASALRRDLAEKAWQYAADYDRAILAGFRGSRDRSAWSDSALESERFSPLLTRKQVLRYGENPHQKAAWLTSGPLGLQEAQVLQGKELSYNNILDLVAAAALAYDLGPGGAAVIKHQTPCGAARRGTVAESLAAAIAADRTSAFGGVIALSGIVDRDVCDALGDLFVEVIVACSATDEAREKLAKRKNLRLVVWPEPRFDALECRGIPGGLLVQTRDAAVPGSDAPPRVVTKRAPTDAEWEDLRTAEIVAKHVRSNAIALVKDRVTTGIGGGHVSRVDAVHDAIRKAGDSARGSVMASDAFFPFPDGLEAAPGVTAVVQPGGSIRDEDVIAAADRLGLAMVFSGVRHFRH